MPRKKSAAEAPVVESYESLLRHTLERLKIAVFDESTSPRDLAALTKRMLDVKKELEGLEGSEGGEVSADGNGSDASDEKWEPV